MKLFISLLSQTSNEKEILSLCCYQLNIHRVKKCIATQLTTFFLDTGCMNTSLQLYMKSITLILYTFKQTTFTPSTGNNAVTTL